MLSFHRLRKQKKENKIDHRSRNTRLDYFQRYFLSSIIFHHLSFTFVYYLVKTSGGIENPNIIDAYRRNNNDLGTLGVWELWDRD